MKRKNPKTLQGAKHTISIEEADDDLDFDVMTDDEVVAYLMRRCDISREEAVQNWRDARREVQAAADALLAACAGGEVEATGINIKTGKRETIPPFVFKAR